jgi:hypothetical protein
MASACKQRLFDRRTRLRALQLRDAALKIRALIESWQPGARIHAVHVGPFRIAYGENNVVPLRARPGAGPPRFSAEIAAERKLFHIERTDDASLVLRRFERGPWERSFLRRSSERFEAG